MAIRKNVASARQTIRENNQNKDAVYSENGTITDIVIRNGKFSYSQDNGKTFTTEVVSTNDVSISNKNIESVKGIESTAITQNMINQENANEINKKVNKTTTIAGKTLENDIELANLVININDVFSHTYNGSTLSNININIPTKISQLMVDGELKLLKEIMLKIFINRITGQPFTTLTDLNNALVDGVRLKVGEFEETIGTEV